jgi:asparagine synthase (glutamine-hydrolysing)
VKVVLSGAGGDELFGGYPWRYYRALRATDLDGYYRDYYDYWQRVVPDADRSALFNQQTYRRVSESPPFDSFRAVFSEGPRRLDDVEDIVNASLYFECKTFLQGLFVVEDKLSMAHGLETRVPFMDNDLADFAMRIPPRFKLRDLIHAPRVDENDTAKHLTYQSATSDGKVALRRAMRQFIPDDVTNRAKQGFSAPDASWFRGESIDYINRLLRSDHARIYEYLDGAYVGRRLDEHSSGQRNHRLFIWSVLSFEWWLRTFLPS